MRATVLLSSVVADALLGAVMHAQVAPGPPETAPAPLIPNAKPARSCESLAMVALPNTTIESAAVDPQEPGICRNSWNGPFLGTAVTGKALTDAFYGVAPRTGF